MTSMQKKLQFRTFLYSFLVLLSAWVFNFCFLQLTSFHNGFVPHGGIKTWPAIDSTLLDVLLVGPIIEEFFFRKLTISFVERRIGTTFACLVSALLFSLAHLINFNNFTLIARETLDLFALFTTGFFYAIIYVKTRRIVYPIFAHIITNFIVLIPKDFLYIGNMGFSYYPHAFIGLVAAAYLAYSTWNTLNGRKRSEQESKSIKACEISAR